MMAIPPPQSASLLKRLLPSQSNEGSSPAKKSNTVKFGISAISLKTIVERGFDLFIAHGIMTQDKKIVLLNSMPTNERTTLLTQEESENWCSDSLKAVVQQIVILSQNRFSFSCPDKIPSEDFYKIANEFVDEYTEYLIMTLRECSYISLDEHILELLPKAGLLFPLKPERCPKESQPKVSFDIRAKFQAIYDFCLLRKTILWNERIADEIEAVIHHLWDREKLGIVSLSEGDGALYLGYTICRLMKKGDFHIEQRKKWLDDRIQSYTSELAHDCRKVARIDFRKEWFSTENVSDESRFPIKAVPNNPTSKACTTSGQMLFAWMLQLQTQPLLKEISGISLLINKIQSWATANLKDQERELELAACKSLNAQLFGQPAPMT